MNIGFEQMTIVGFTSPSLNGRLGVLAFAMRFEEHWRSKEASASSESCETWNFVAIQKRRKGKGACAYKADVDFKNTGIFSRVF